MTLRLSTSGESAARFRESYAARMERRRNGRPWRPPGRTSDEETVAFRDLVLSKIGRLTPKRFTRIHADVIDDWGDACPKRTWRALKWLVDNGRIARGDEGYLLSRRR